MFSLIIQYRSSAQLMIVLSPRVFFPHSLIYNDRINLRDSKTSTQPTFGVIHNNQYSVPQKSHQL